MHAHSISNALAPAGKRTRSTGVRSSQGKSNASSKQAWGGGKVKESGTRRAEPTACDEEFPPLTVEEVLSRKSELFLTHAARAQEVLWVTPQSLQAAKQTSPGEYRGECASHGDWRQVLSLVDSVFGVDGQRKAKREAVAEAIDSLMGIGEGTSTRSGHTHPFRGRWSPATLIEFNGVLHGLRHASRMRTMVNEVIASRRERMTRAITRMIAVPNGIKLRTTLRHRIDGITAGYLKPSKYERERGERIRRNDEVLRNTQAQTAAHALKEGELSLEALPEATAGSSTDEISTEELDDTGEVL